MYSNHGVMSDELEVIMNVLATCANYTPITQVSVRIRTV